MKIIAQALCLLALLALQSGVATAQQYPSRMVRNILPLTPGGLGDMVLRAISAELAKTLGQPVVVENRGGANTAVGGEACARAAPDGYTICMLTVDTISYNPFLYRKLQYDPHKDFEPIINVFFLTEGFMVNPSLKAGSLAEMIALAKSRAGFLNYASPANAVVLFMENFKNDTATDIKMIPYKGGGDAVNALLGGEVQVGFFGIGNLIGHLKAGRIRLLAVDGTSRSPLFPEVPTLVEAGYHAVQNRIWFGILGPAGIPKPVVFRLNAEIARIVGVPAFKEQYITPLGLEAILDTPEHFAQFIREDRVRAERLVRQSGLKPE